MATTFTTTVFQDEGSNATGLKLPAEAVEALGKGKRPPVVITVNGFAYRTTVAVMGRDYVVPLSAERRHAAGVSGGDTVEVTVELDTQPRTIEVPEDLATALAAKPGATEAFDKLAPSARKEHVRQVESAKAQETRERRIAKIVDSLA